MVSFWMRWASPRVVGQRRCGLLLSAVVAWTWGLTIVPLPAIAQSELQQIEQLERQWQAANQRGDWQAEKTILQQLTAANLQSGAIGNQIDVYKRFIAVTQKLNSPGEEMFAWSSLAAQYRILGNVAEELATLTKMLERAQTLKDPYNQANALTLSGVAHRRLANYPASIAALQQALTLTQQQRSNPLMLDLEWQARGYLALTQDAAGNLPAAIALQEENLAFARQFSLQTIYPRSREADTLRALSRVQFLQGNVSQAIATIQQSLDLLPKTDALSLGVAQTLEEQGYMLFKAGKLSEAEQVLRQANTTYTQAWAQRLASIRQFAQLGSKTGQDWSIRDYNLGIDAQRFLQQVLIAQNRPEAALEASEAGRTRAFVNLLALRQSGQENPLQPPSIRDMVQIAQEQQATLVEYSIIYDDAVSYKIKFGLIQPRPLELLIWVVQPSGSVTFRRVDLNTALKQDSLATVVANAREEIAVGGRGLTFAEDAAPIVRTTDQTDQSTIVPEFQSLHRLLIEPIADILPKDPNARIILIPQDFLFLVPFVALQDAQGNYLIQNHTILTAPSIQTLQFTRQQRLRLGVGEPSALGVGGKVSGVADPSTLDTPHPTPHTLHPTPHTLIVGNPTMPSLRPRLDAKPQQLSSLPGSETEAKAIATLFNTQAVIGSRATKAAIVQALPHARIIHFATHGLLDKFGGFQSALALTPAGNDNGLLTAQEIMNLRLTADLVVLSACDTGRGKINGDGVVGLSRAFIAAGAPSVIVSLWKVPDAPTSDLMQEFYRVYTTGKTDKAQALRQAMLTTLEQYPDPRDWAAFTLVGEAE